MSKSKPEPSSWEAKLQRRREFCQRFVAEHHPEMADAHKIKGAHPLKPLDPVRRIYDGIDSDWWLQTDKSISALGCTYLGYLFGRHHLLDHDWMIGRSDQELWALVSKPYGHASALAEVVPLRHELEKIGVDLIQYPSEQSTHAPGRTQMLVANVIDIHTLCRTVAGLIVASGKPPHYSIKSLE